MGRKTNFFILIPLAAFATLIIGAGMYMTLCKNALVSLPC
ncbi:conserved exported protein of unknown function [Nitrosopumilus piranensis]|uniref:Uncharacterized protein n=1 Tax=Nitrosopumilus piranensis TaxID=1582439 RepID=A0A0C5C026_9ARCH|nr:conserved exported protein of unknown function [Nitrosopumilus piranensis]